MAFKKSEDPKSTFVRIRLTPTEKAEVENRAFDAGETTSSYMLKASLSRPIRSHSERHEINELRLFIMNLKEIYFAGTPAQDDRLTPLLEAAVAALNARVGKPRHDR